MESKYIIDANVFMTAHRQRYPFDIAPSFWEQLVDKAADKMLIIEAYREIINSVNDNEDYKQSAKDEFASIADSWLCAYAFAYGATIVTLETYQAGVKNRIKIPNVCKEFDIRYIDLLQFMREIGIRM